MDPQILEPEFCPNSACRYHDRTAAAVGDWYTRFGRFMTRCRGAIQRFRCRACGKTCSTQTFSVHYWTHSTMDLSWLLEHLYGCDGLRNTGRCIDVGYRVIGNRTRRLARNALSVMDEALHRVELRENLAIDGFQSYTRSQYHPNNITQVIGSKSQFIYAAVHTLLRRSGSMRPYQRRQRARIDRVWRPTTSIARDTTVVFQDLRDMIVAAADRPGGITIASDKHRAYPIALKAVPELALRVKDKRLTHRQVSSRAARTVKNPLFPVNYVDRQIRKNMGEHVRETCRQGREVNCQMERMAVFIVAHNFLTPHRVANTVDVDACPTHAQMAGIDNPEVQERLSRLFTHRHVWSHSKTKYEWIRRIWQHEYVNPPVVRVKRGKVVTRTVALPPRRLAAHLLA
jgi:hypothetical protein